MGVTLAPAADHAAALRRLGVVVPHAVDGATLDDMAKGCDLYDVADGDRITGCIAVEWAGADAYVTAAADQSARWPDVVAQFERMAQGRGARRVVFVTARPGMVRRMTGLGYGLQMAKCLKEI